MDEITVEAVIDNLERVTVFVDSRLEALDCPADAQFQIEVAMEELFTNIANYAYAPGTGSVTVRAEGEPRALALTFIDSAGGEADRRAGGIHGQAVHGRDDLPAGGWEECDDHPEEMGIRVKSGEGHSEFRMKIG